MPSWIQYASKRLGDEFVDMLSYKRGWKGRCAECGAPFAVLYSISFGAEFCCPGCYIRFNKGYIETMTKELLK